MQLLIRVNEHELCQVFLKHQIDPNVRNTCTPLKHSAQSKPPVDSERQKYLRNRFSLKNF